MALDRILESIEADAEAEIAKIRAGADARAQADMAEAEARARLRAAARRARAEEEQKRLRSSLLAEVDADALRELGRARAEIASRALSEARARLAALREDPARASLVTAALLREALSWLPGARLVKVDARDAEVAARTLQATGSQAAVSPTLATWGGAILDDGRGATLDNTLEARLSRMEPELGVAISQEIPALFQGSYERRA